MTLQQLSYLLEVSHQGSINKAAGALYLSQSAVSSAIKELELELGITIFERTARGVQLTADGQELMGYVRPLLEQRDKITAAFSGGGVVRHSRLSVSTQRYPFTIDAFLRFYEERSEEHFEYRIREAGMYRVIQDVGESESEVGVIFLSNVTEKYIKKVLASQNIEFTELCRIDPHVFIRRGHPLSGRAAIEPHELNAYPYLAFDRDFGATLDYAEEVRLFSPDRPSQIFIVHDRATAYNILANTDAYTLGSGMLIEGLVEPRLMTVPMAGTYEQMRLGWIRLKSNRLSDNAWAFIERLKETIRLHTGREGGG